MSEKKETIVRFNKFREICLKNAEDLLRGAKASLDAGVDHASFHLSLLALEEMGKIELEAIKTLSKVHPTSEPITYKFAIDDHERKIFWALWGPSFGREKQTKERIDTTRGLASNLHERRLAYLYSEPVNPQHWSDLMEEGEAARLYSFVEVRLKLEQAEPNFSETFAEEPHEDVVWFFKANEDEQRKKEIWGHKSQEKLIEFGNAREWIKWLREVYEKHDQETKELVEKEMRREEPSEEEKLNPKWRMRLEIITPSHSVRQQNLKEFNDAVHWITLTRRDAHTLGVELMLSKNVPVQGLWDFGWGMARAFVASLNIATHGFFWWNVKKDPSKYYEEIWDMENDMGVSLEANPRLEVNWQEKRLVLRPVDLSVTSLMFSYLGHCHGTKKDEYVSHYFTGLNLLAKNDIHLRVEMNTFEEFFKCLKMAMIENGDWDQKAPFEEAYQKATSWKFSEITADMQKYFPLGFKVEQDHTGAIDLTGVYAMKLYCEVYLQTLMLRYFKEEKGQELRFEVGEYDGE